MELQDDRSVGGHECRHGLLIILFAQPGGNSVKDLFGDCFEFQDEAVY